MNQLAADVVSRIEYDEKEQECMAKDEQIQVRRDFVLSRHRFVSFRFVRLDSSSENSTFGTFVAFERRSRGGFNGEIGTSARPSDQPTALNVDNEVIFLSGASTWPCRFLKRERKKN